MAIERIPMDKLEPGHVLYDGAVVLSTHPITGRSGANAKKMYAIVRLKDGTEKERFWDFFGMIGVKTSKPRKGRAKMKTMSIAHLLKKKENADNA